MINKVSYGQLYHAYEVMEAAIGKKHLNPRTCLMKYLDGIPLPVISDLGRSYILWAGLGDDVFNKLEMLLSDHGHTIAKAWLAKQEN